MKNLVYFLTVVFCSWQMVEAQCTSPVSLPYSENFNQDTGCFTPINGGNTPDTWFQDTAGVGTLDGTGYMIVNSDAAGSGNTLSETLESPVINAASLNGSLIMEFDQYFRSLGSSDSGQVQVYDGASWITVYVVENTIGAFSAPNHQLIDVTIYANANFQVRFIYDDNNSFAWYWLIDNFELKEVTCSDPIVLSSNATDTSLAFTLSGVSDTFDIEWGPVGFLQGTGCNAQFQSNTFTITNASVTGICNNPLMAQTCYDFYFRKNCTGTGNGTSAWVGPFQYCTTCPKQNLPYSENFNSQMFGCISVVDGGSSPDTWVIEPAGGSSVNGDLDGTAFAIANSDAPGSGPTLFEIMETPAIDADTINGVLTLDFDHYYRHLSSSGKVEVFDGVQWVSVYTVTANTGNFSAPNHQTINVSVYANADFKVRFVYDDMGNWAWWWMVDNIQVRDIVCPDPTALGAFGATTTTTNLYWSSGGASNSIVEYGPAGFTLGQGTSVTTMNDTLNVTGLTAGTAYEFYVQDSCSSGSLSTPVGPFAFNTEVCDTSQSCVFGVTLTDDFGDGWNGAEISFLQNGVSVKTVGANFTSAVNNGDSLQTTVRLCDSITTYVVLTNAGTFSYEIGYKIFSPFPMLVDSINPTTFGNGPAAGDTLGIFTASCALPSCPAPNSLGVSSIGDTSATLNWTDPGFAGSYQVWFGPQGFFQATTTVGGTKFLTNTSSAVIDTLRGNFCYEYLVRAICAPGDSSLWAGPFVFCTTCPPFTAPYLEDFENFTVGHFDGTERCWEFQSNNPGTTPSGNYSWEVRNTAQTTSGTTTGPSGDRTLFPAMGGHFITADVSGSSGTVPDSTLLISPVVDISGLANPELSYSVYRYGTQMADLYVDVFNGTSWDLGLHSYTNAIGAQTSQADAWTDTVLDLSNYIAQTDFQVRFRSVSNGCCAGDNAIDDVTILEAGATFCSAPTNLAANVVSCDSIIITWNTAADTSFIAALDTNFASPPILAPIYNDSSYTLTGTMANTGYLVIVSNVCGSDTSQAAFTLVDVKDEGAPVASIGTPVINGFTVNFDASASTGSGNNYAWDFGDGNSGTGVTTSNTYATGGAFTAKLVVSNNCGTDSATVTLANVSLEETNIGGQLLMFPNPATDELNLDIQLDERSAVTMRLLDVSGKIVMSKNYGEVGLVSDRLDVANLANGVYTVQVQTATGTANVKLIKQ